MTASGFIAIGACTAVLGWSVYHIVRGALEERERRYREQLLVRRVREREERERREYAQAMAGITAWCREQSAKADAQVRELERLFELPCAPDPKWIV